MRITKSRDYFERHWQDQKLEAMRYTKVFTITVVEKQQNTRQPLKQAKHLKNDFSCKMFQRLKEIWTLCETKNDHYEKLEPFSTRPRVDPHNSSHQDYSQNFYGTTKCCESPELSLSLMLHVLLAMALSAAFCLRFSRSSFLRSSTVCSSAS